MLKLTASLPNYASGGYVRVNLAITSTMGTSGGFNGPVANLVCTLYQVSNSQKYGCMLAYVTITSQFYVYQITTF